MNDDKKAYKKKKHKPTIIFGVVILFVALILIVITPSWFFQPDWKVKDLCQQPLLPVQPKKVPSQITGINRRILNSRQFSRSSFMPSAWEQQAPLPKLEDSITGSVMDIGIQESNIWLIRPGLLQQYNLEEKVLDDYRLTDKGKEITWIRYMHIMDDGTAWFLVRTNTGYFFTKYDEGLDTLKTIQDQNNLFSIWKDAEIRDFNFDSNMGDTDSGELLIPYKKNIIVYNPDSNIARFLLPESFVYKIRSIASSEGYVWFTVEAKELWSFNLLTNELTNHGNEIDLEGYEEIPPIAVDGLGRVWVGYKARLDPAGNGQYAWWKPVSYPLEFIVLANRNLDYLSGYDAFYLEWAYVRAIKATSDGNLWFSTGSGVVNYDIYNDEWCLSASVFPKTFAEDMSGSLWIGLGNHSSYRGIFKYDLNLSDK